MTSPQQTFETLVQELSASGSTPLLDPSGNRLTLRQAVGWVFTKCSAVLSLSGRPRTPSQADDLYGHILSLRAEQLITQAILAELATRSGVNVADIRNQAIASF